MVLGKGLATIGLKRLFKSWILSFLLSSKDFFPNYLKKGLLRMMRIDFMPQKSEEEAVSVCRYKYGSHAAFCISIDFDDINREKAHLHSRGTLVTLRLAEKFDIAMSWAICGITTINESEVFKQILNSKVRHDVGIHTFSHRIFDSSCTRDDARVETLRCIEVLKLKKQPTTFIFPHNVEGHFDVLKELGFVTYRSQERRLGYPSREYDLWNIPPVYYLDEKSFRALDLVKKFLDFSLTYRCVFHLWFHPWSIAVKDDVELYAKSLLEPLLLYANEKRRLRQLWICTLRELANYCEARMNCHIMNFTQSEHEITLSVRCSNDKRFDSPPEVTLRIPLPTPQSDVTAFVDEEPCSLGAKCYVQNLQGRDFLLLTLSFTKTVIPVRVTLQDSSILTE